MLGHQVSSQQLHVIYRTKFSFKVACKAIHDVRLTSLTCLRFLSLTLSFRHARHLIILRKHDPLKPLNLYSHTFYAEWPLFCTCQICLKYSDEAFPPPPKCIVSCTTSILALNTLYNCLLSLTPPWELLLIFVFSACRSAWHNVSWKKGK